MKKIISVFMSVVILGITMGMNTTAFAEDESRIVYEGTTTCYNVPHTVTSSGSQIWSSYTYTDYEAVTYYFKAKQAGVYLIKLPAEPGDLFDVNMTGANGSYYKYLKEGETFPFNYYQYEEVAFDSGVYTNYVEKYNVTVSKVTTPFEYTDENQNCKFIINPNSATAELKSTFRNKIPESVIGCTVTSIGKYAFGDRSGFEQIVLPKTVTYIDSYAFAGCIRLQKVTGVNPACKFGEQIFLGCPNSAAVYDCNGKRIDLNSNFSADKPVDKNNTSKDVLDDNKTSETKPAKVNALSVKSKTKALAVYWNRVSGINGYQIQVATDKNFNKNKKSVTVTKQNASKKTVNNLKKNKKYYVRIRAYKNINSKKFYGKWSKTNSVKTK